MVAPEPQLEPADIREYVGGAAAGGGAVEGALDAGFCAALENRGS